jgi:hypothetical protein
MWLGPNEFGTLVRRRRGSERGRTGKKTKTILALILYILGRDKGPSCIGGKNFGYSSVKYLFSEDFAGV